MLFKKRLLSPAA